MVNVGRNDPCPCGSGKKAKHCCYRFGNAPASERPVLLSVPHTLAGTSTAPIDPVALYHEATALANKGDFDMAEARLVEAIKARRDFAEAHFTLAQVLWGK